MTKLANFIAFQIGWFACALGGAHDRPWLGTAIALVIVAWHVARAARPAPRHASFSPARGSERRSTARWSPPAGSAYPSGTLLRGTAPHWLVAMWPLFGTTLNVSLRWLRRSLPSAGLLGAIGGPLAYWGGERLGGMTFVEPVAATSAMAVGWMVLTPVLVLLATRFDGYAPAAPADPEPRPRRA